MQTPICDFVKNYIEKNQMRLHMPGHKGCAFLGAEPFDITEIDGADSLYEASGIIAESEKNASELFGCDTFYSTEGSSQCIRAMLYLATQHAKNHGKKPMILAGRNAHKTFLSAAALCDLDVKWLFPENQESYLSCRIDATTLDRALSRRDITAVYLTSPDYLGNILDIKSLSEVCRKHDVLLLVDNAHGAYLKFTTPSQHPIDLGADMCCDSAHKTLPVLTGGAYLHVADTCEELLLQTKNALSLFGSTSPSYLILQSLDRANAYVADGYTEQVEEFSQRVKALKTRLMLHGYILKGNEPLKLTIKPKPYGYKGTDFSNKLLEQDIVCEFSDPDFTVMMLTPETDLERLEKVLLSVSKKTAIMALPPKFFLPERAMSIREATFAPSKTVPVEQALGRILATATVGCPPAVPIVTCGERITAEAIEVFKYYGIKTCTIVK